MRRCKNCGVVVLLYFATQTMLLSEPSKDQLVEPAVTEPSKDQLVKPAVTVPSKNAVPANAGKSGSFRDSVYLDIFGFGGTTGTNTLAGPQPALMNFGGGLTAALKLDNWIGKAVFVGATTDIRYVGQYSAVDATVGNRRGMYLNYVSPVLGARIDDIILKLDLQFLGNYKLLNPTVDGSTISFSSPLGGRFSALFQLHKGVFAGAQLEYLRFTNQRNSATGNNTALTEPLNLWQLGLSIGYAL